MAERRGAYRRAVPLPLSLEKEMTPRAGKGEPTVANYCYIGGGRRGREWEPLDSTVVDRIINRLNDMIVPNQVILEIPYIPAYNWKSAKLLLGEHIQGSAQPQLEVVPGMLAEMDLPLKSIASLKSRMSHCGWGAPPIFASGQMTSLKSPISIHGIVETQCYFPSEAQETTSWSLPSEDAGLQTEHVHPDKEYVQDPFVHWIINRLNDMIVPNQVILEIPYIPAYNWKSAKLLLGEHIQGSAQPQLEVVPGMLAKMDLPSAIFRLRPKKQRVGEEEGSKRNSKPSSEGDISYLLRCFAGKREREVLLFRDRRLNPASAPGLLQISVVTGDGAAKSRICSTILAREEITAKVLEKIPVPSLKEQIGVFTGVSSYQQLDFRGRDSRDDKLLSDYHGGSSSGQHQGNNRSGISNLFEQKTLDFQRNKFICALLQLGSLTLESFSSSSVWSYYPC
nr:large proline-rich protein BAG6 isoform X5 [Ipomoea batatas]